MSGRMAIGLVLDAGILHAVEVAAEGDRLVIRRAVCEPLPAKAFVDGELADAGAVAEAVGRVFRAHKLPRTNICVALGGRLSIARIVEVAETSATEAEQMIQDRIAQYAIYEDLEVLWKAVPLESEAGAEQEPQKHSYLIAAASQKQVAALLPALQRAGIQASDVEPYALAGLRGLMTYLNNDERPTIVVTLRNEGTDFQIVKGRQPLLVRSVDEGARHLVRQPQTLEDLSAETKRSVDFCRGRFVDVEPRVWLCDESTQGTPAAAALLARLQKDLEGTETDVLPPWPHTLRATVTVDESRRLWAAVGVAMVGLPVFENIPHLNLVPPEWPEMERIQKHLAGVVVAVSVAVLITVAVATTLRVTLGDMAERADAASVEMKANTTRVKTAVELKRKAAEAVARVSLWKDVRAEVKPFDWAASLDVVLAQIPEGVRVGQLAYRKGSLRLVGEAQSTDFVHQMVQRMSRLPQLEEASIERLVRTPGPGSRWPGYTVTCRFREQAPRPVEEGKKRDR